MALYAFNGTWNSEKTDDISTAANEAASNTNVVFFKDAHTAPAPYYSDGVGTRVGLVGKIFGGAFGVGGQQRLDEAIAHLRKRFNNGDRDIDVVGFSRGAALALAFANRVAKDIKDGQGRPVKIRFLGLSMSWDPSVSRSTSARSGSRSTTLATSCRCLPTSSTASTQWPWTSRARRSASRV